ncbi:hypothetical protein CFP56_027992 [Quercus suber]|uniref:Uncharacterized protein n=1 Tax=Quercus suber TaxID=58331 RepID=A0AAW0JWV5_QUESU
MNIIAILGSAVLQIFQKFQGSVPE